MSVGTQSKDCHGPFYPQWGEARGVDSGEVAWTGIPEDANPGAGAGADSAAGADAVADAESDADAGAINGEEPWRDDGTPEPWGPDAGATTAEYAITTLAACGFAALLVVILKSEPIKELVTGVIETALGLGV